MKVKILFSIAVVLMVLAFPLGCATPSNDVDEVSDNDVAEFNDEPLEFTMIVCWPEYPYQQAFMYGAEQKAEELGVDLSIHSSGGDTSVALELIDTVIMQEKDGLLLAIDLEYIGVVPGIEKLNEAGIPVIALEVSPAGGEIDLFISFDLVNSSKQSAEILIESIKEAHYGEVPEGILIEIIGTVESSWTEPTGSGLRAVVDQYPQLTIVTGEGHYNNVDTHRITTDLLTRHGDEIVAIWVETPDIMGLGAVEAIEAAGFDPKDYHISGICMGPEGKLLIEEGKVAGIVAQPALDYGTLGIQYLYNIVKGEPIPQIGDLLIEEGEIWSPAEVIENPYIEGSPYLVLSGIAVPHETSVDDPRLYEKQMEHLW